MTDAPEQFWFLSYESTSTNRNNPPFTQILNVVLAGIHPLVWLSQPPDVYRQHFVSKALFFKEIDAAIFADLVRLNYISCEDHRHRSNA